MSRSHRGFTMIEILVVISIIAILAALLMPALSMLRNKQKQVATQKLLQSVTFALDQYISTYAVFGTDPGTTKTLSGGETVSQSAWETPLKFLITEPREPYLELKLNQMGKGNPPTQVSKPDEAEVLYDAWFQPINVYVVNLQADGRGPWYTEKVMLVSPGADTRLSDDVLYGMEIAEGRWKQEKIFDYDASDYMTR